MLLCQQVFGLVDLGCDEGRSSPVRVVQQHHSLVALGDPLGRRRRRHPEDQRRLPSTHFALEKQGIIRGLCYFSAQDQGLKGNRVSQQV